MTAPTHPGTITFVDDTSERVRAASEVPESIRFAKVGDALVPVVRVVARVEGDQRFIREYAADGALVRTTVQRRQP